MNAVVILWSMISAVALTLGGIHLVVWLKSRKATSLAFALAAVSVSVIALLELAMMHTADPRAFGRIMQWTHIPVFTLFCGFILFVRLHLGGSWRFAIAILALRLISLMLNFTFPPNLNYAEIRSLDAIDFLGESVFVVGQATANPLQLLDELTILLNLLFTLGAMRECWRRNGAGDRRKALLVGGTYVLYVFVMLFFSALLHRGVIQVPYLISTVFLSIIVIMGYELSRDVIEAARVSGQLKENLASMNLATRAAHLSVWNWDIPRDSITVGEYGRRLYGVSDDAPVTFARFLATLHPGDRDPVRLEVEAAMRARRDFEADYRVLLPDGSIRWINASGTFLYDANQRDPVRMLGVSMDITGRKQSEEEARCQREELAHISRVTTLGELSGSLAHEINQPLAIMLSNAQAAQRLLERDPPDLDEVRDILADIVQEDRRASEVIRKMRDLLRRGEARLAEQDMNQLALDALALVHPDLLGRGIELQKDITPGLPSVLGDRVQLQQVILNIIRNAAEAVRHQPPGKRIVRIATGIHQGRMCFSVRDSGDGIDGNIERIFQPYFTTKEDGLGLGLAICRSIMQAHHGWLWAENHPEGGAVFHMELPIRSGGGAA